MTKQNVIAITSVCLIYMSLSNIPSYANESTSSKPEGPNVVKSLSDIPVENKNTDVSSSIDNLDNGKLISDRKKDTSDLANVQKPNISASSTLSQSASASQNYPEKESFDKKYQEYVNKFDNLLKTTETNIETLNKKLESIYIADKKIGGVDGPGYYYRFKNDSNSLLLKKGLYYVYTKRGHSDTNLLKGMLVNFSLSEKRPSGKTISQATNISLTYNDDLPSIAKLVFTIAKPGDSIKIVTLAEYIYPTKELLPSGVEPDDTLIYTFDINRQYEK